MSCHATTVASATPLYLLLGYMEFSKNKKIKDTGKGILVWLAQGIAHSSLLGIQTTVTFPIYYVWSSTNTCRFDGIADFRSKILEFGLVDHHQS